MLVRDLLLHVGVNGNETVDVDLLVDQTLVTFMIRRNMFGRLQVFVKRVQRVVL